MYTVMDIQIHSSIHLEKETKHCRVALIISTHRMVGSPPQCCVNKLVVLPLQKYFFRLRGFYIHDTSYSKIKYYSSES